MVAHSLSRLDLNPIAIVNEHAFAAAPTLELMYGTVMIVVEGRKEGRTRLACVSLSWELTVTWVNGGGDTRHAYRRSYLPFDVQIQRQAFAEMKTDKRTFDGFARVAAHALEDPHFVAFAKS